MWTKEKRNVLYFFAVIKIRYLKTKQLDHREKKFNFKENFVMQVVLN